MVTRRLQTFEDVKVHAGNKIALNLMSALPDSREVYRNLQSPSDTYASNLQGK
jgi:hypothetical protein